MKRRPIAQRESTPTALAVNRTPPAGEPAVLTKVAELLQALSQQSNVVSDQASILGRGTDEQGERITARELTDALLDRLTRRMPKGGKGDQPGETCPYSGLNRSALYELINKRENGKPVIKSVTLREEGEKHGARFYNVGSVLRYLDRLADLQAQQETEA